jgi:diguanylate cyclase (GGDEF)-like protein
MVAERSEWFERMAHTDPLTGLANERTFSRILELELARAGRQGGEVSLVIFDVDGQTATNEAVGHAAGDDVLRAVAAVLAESVRLVDTVARIGGDEFVLVAPGAAGTVVAQRVLDGIAALPARDGRSISVSAGVAKFPSDAGTAEDLKTAANAALDAARTAGTGGLGAPPAPATEG